MDKSDDKDVLRPVWCAECGDRPADGRLVMLIRGTNQELKPTAPVDTRVCRRCGLGREGHILAENEETGQVAVLHYCEGSDGADR